MDRPKIFLIDFDSTFTKVEALDVLCDIIYQHDDRKEAIAAQVAMLTDRAMDGDLSFRQALEERLSLLEANSSHLQQLTDYLRTQVSESFKRNGQFLQEQEVYILSSGFRTFIEPVVAEYGIPADRVFANDFRFDEQGNVLGFDASNPLSEQGGKVKLVQQLGLQQQGEVIAIGDGYTDYEVRQAGLADRFYAFTENVSRPKVVAQADVVAPNLEEILFSEKLPMATSYPKHRIKALLLENVHPISKQRLEAEGYTVELLKTALTEDELCERIKDVSLLGIRSNTFVTRKVLESANKLIAVGAFCIGTNQIDLAACQEKGVAVFNAPFSNTRSVVELALGEIILLMRRIPERMREMDQGIWKKSAISSHEVRGKKLGLVGYGNIGSQLSILAEAVGMEVYYYDVVEKLALGNARKMRNLDEMLSICDVVSLHIDGRKENAGFFDAAKIAKMKKGAILVNLARGGIIDLSAVAEAVASGQLGGVGFDVFPVEPKSNKDPFISPFGDCANVVLTPHIGGSTEEAQENIGEFVPEKMIEYVNTGGTFTSVNFPNLQLPHLDNAHRLLHIHKNVSGVLAKINSVFAKHGINIEGQYLKTNEKIGYVITDINKAYDPEVLTDLKAIDGTIKFRVLY